jgi:hypothetical protein
MTWDNSKYIKLLIERPSGTGGDRWLIALRTTADYYGWTQEFERWTPKFLYEQGGYSFFAHPGRGEMFCEAGRRHRICRTDSLHGMPRGKTNQFKVSRTCGLFDLSEIAHFTKSDWHWMSGPSGERISRDRWEAIYQAGPHNRRAGLVSV